MFLLLYKVFYLMSSIVTRQFQVCNSVMKFKIRLLSLLWVRQQTRNTHIPGKMSQLLLLIDSTTAIFCRWKKFLVFVPKAKLVNLTRSTSELLFIVLNKLPFRHTKLAEKNKVQTESHLQEYSTEILFPLPKSILYKTSTSTALPLHETWAKAMEKET